MSHIKTTLQLIAALFFVMTASISAQPPSAAGGDPVGSDSTCDEGLSLVTLGGAWACEASGAPEACADGAEAKFDSTAGVTTDAFGINSVLDQCGNGHEAVQATDNLKPAAGSVSGVAVVDCSGGKVLRDTTFADFSDVATLIVSGRLNDSTDNVIAAVTDGGAVNTGFAIFHDNGSATTRARGPDNTGVDDATVASDTFPANQVWGMTFDGAATTTKLYSLVAGSAALRNTNVTAGSTFAGVLDDIEICRLGTTGAYPLNGWWREIVIWNRVLTDSEIILQMNAMASRLPSP